MKKILSSICISILFLLIVGTINLVSAEEEIQEVNVEGFNFISWFQHTFGIQDFSIVGQDRHCDVYPKKTLYFNYLDLIEVDVNDYCSSGFGLIDVFDGKWNPWKEFKDDYWGYCYDLDDCIVEVYCCPHDECYKDSQCEDWEGPGSECETSYESDPYIDYEYSSYNYCTAECTGSDITCWREESGVCVSRTYDCSYGTYPDCPTSYPYTSKSKCEASLPDVVVCESNADTNNDGVISREPELGVYINKWIDGTKTRIALGKAIMEWIDGC